MDAFIAEFDIKSLLIAGAVGSYVLGFLFRDQIYTRFLVVVGSVLYIVYYGTVGPTPLWDAIIGSVLIGLSSAQGVMRLWFSRMTWVIPKDARHIFESMGQIEPGLFQRLYRAADRATARKDVVLTQQGQAVDRLWYLVDGALQVERVGQEPAMIRQPGFVGEIAWLTDGAATATVTAREGADMLSWPTKKLRGATRKSVRLELALDSLIAQDLARKLSKSHPIEAAPPPDLTPDPAPPSPGVTLIATARP